MAAGRLADGLKDVFGERQIFRDVETIEPGEDFTVVLGRALDGCAVMLAVIGPHWLDLTDAEGRRRLDDPNDWTRLEVGTALARNVRVVPVLVDGARMPEADRLPDDLKGLVRRQALEISDKSWKSDVARLIEVLGKILPPGPRPTPHDGNAFRKYVIGGAVVFGVLLIAGMLYEEREPATPLPVAPNASGQPSDLTGTWSDGYAGKSILMRQAGSNVEISVMYGNVNIGKGAGNLNGSVLRLAHDDWSAGATIRHNCQFTVLPDGRHLAGSCQNALTGFTTAVTLVR